MAPGGWQRQTRRRGGRTLAERLLRDEPHSLAEIAFPTGFSERSPSAPACRRRLGRPPASHRKARPAA